MEGSDWAENRNQEAGHGHNKSEKLIAQPGEQLKVQVWNT